MRTDVDSDEEFIKRAKAEIQRKHGKTPGELYEEREKRVMDAIHMRKPDRVPVAVYGGYFPIFYVGTSPSAIFYDHSLYKRAVIKTLMDFEPDLYRQTMHNDVSGRGIEALEPKQFRWPGGNISPDSGQQFYEMEILKPEEYDLFLTDPTDFMLRYYLPRSHGALAPFSKLPTLGQNLAGTVSEFYYMTPLFAAPEFQKMAKMLVKVGQEQAPYSGWERVLRELGFPPFYYTEWAGTNFGPPFDWLANYLRGMRGVMIDMFSRPEKLLAACEKVLEWRFARFLPPDPNRKEYYRRVIAGATHFSNDGFLTKKQFETFCWPTWKKAVLKAIELGWIPGIYCEGKCDDRVEYFLELPKGKFYVRFEQVNMVRVKEILGEHCCICGNVPSTLLKLGSPQEVEDYCRNLIKVCGKGGGFILETGSSIEMAKPANFKAMVDSVKKYGVY